MRHLTESAVKKSDWKIKPMPRSLRTAVVLDRRYSCDQMALIRRGHYPEEMSDHWFMYFEKDRLYVHRGWTGHCIYAIRFVPDDDGFRMVNALVNRNPKQYRETDDSVDAREIPDLISEILLNQMPVRA